MARWHRDCDACRRELQALVASTANGLHDIRRKQSPASSAGTLLSEEISEFVKEQLEKVEHAKRVWIEPHAWKEGPRRMGPMLQEIEIARQRIIEIGRET